ncbi:MAG: class I SAM-dependent methyltransferase [Chloroflexota bacterium]
MTDTTEPQGAITEYWNHRGAVYDAQPGHGIHGQAERDAWLSELRVLLPTPPADVLDVGTGTGFLAQLIAELGHRATGVDLSEGMLGEARAKAAALPDERRPALLVGDAHDPPLPPASQDAIVSRHVLWTLRDPALALKNWSALLRPGGLLVIIDGLWWQDSDPDAPIRADAATHERWLRAYGPDARRDGGLAMMLAQTMDPITASVEAGGFADPRLSRLEQVECVEREAEPGRARWNERYVISARRPV